MGNTKSGHRDAAVIVSNLTRLGYTVKATLRHTKQHVAVLLADMKVAAVQQQAGAHLKVVIKVINYSASDALHHRANHELSVLRIICSSRQRCPYVVPLINAMEGKRRLFLVFPYMDGGDLCRHVMAHKQGLPAHEARRYFIHILRALYHMKRCGVAHGDVSLENVVLSARRPGSPSSRDGCADDTVYRAHLTDFGGACIAGPDGLCPSSQYTYEGKAANIPPELLQEGSSRSVVDPFAVDVWALGTCLYNLLTGRRLYDSPSAPAFAWLSSGKTLELIMHYEQSYDVALDPLARDLVCMMLYRDPSKRPTVEQVLQHPWVSFDTREAMAG